MKNISISLISAFVIISSMALTDNVAQSSSNRAVIQQVHNKVQARTVSEPVWKNAGIAKGLDQGDSIRTGSSSRVEVKYSDGTITRLGSNSVMKITHTKDSKRTGLKLLIGKLWLKVTKGQGLLQIVTPTALASVLGTELLVTNDDKDVSHVTTLDGLVEVTSNSGEKVLVHPGEWVEIAPGKPMEKPTPFDWASLKKNERFILDSTILADKDDFKDENNWK